MVRKEWGGWREGERCNPVRRAEADHRRSRDFILSAAGAKDAGRGRVDPNCLCSKCLGCKTIIRYCCKPVNIYQSKPIKIQNTWWHQMLVRMWSNRDSLSLIAGESANWHSYLGRQFCQFLTKWNILLPCDPAIVLPGVYPNESTTCIHTKTCTWVFMADSDHYHQKTGLNQDVLQQDK